MTYISKNGSAYQARIGSRAQVMHGTAYMTSGGLTKSQLKYNKHNRIVSAKLSEHGKKHGLKRLAAAGFAPFSKGAVGEVRMLTGGRRTLRRPSAVRRRS